jgi:hypothetical protein
MNVPAVFVEYTIPYYTIRKSHEDEYKFTGDDFRKLVGRQTFVL